MEKGVFSPHTIAFGSMWGWVLVAVFDGGWGRRREWWIGRTSQTCRRRGEECVEGALDVREKVIISS